MTWWWWGCASHFWHSGRWFYFTWGLLQPISRRNSTSRSRCARSSVLNCLCTATGGSDPICKIWSAAPFWAEKDQCPKRERETVPWKSWWVPCHGLEKWNWRTFTKKSCSFRRRRLLRAKTDLWDCTLRCLFLTEKCYRPLWSTSPVLSIL